MQVITHFHPYLKRWSLSEQNLSAIWKNKENESRVHGVSPTKWSRGRLPILTMLSPPSLGATFLWGSKLRFIASF